MTKEHQPNLHVVCAEKPIAKNGGQMPDEGAADDLLRRALERVASRSIREIIRYCHIEELTRTLPAGSRVLLPACGKAISELALAYARPDLRLVCADLDAKHFALAQRESRQARCGNISFEVHDTAAEIHPRLGKFNLIVMFNALIHIDDPARAVEHLRAALVPGGRIALVEPFIDAPKGTALEIRLREKVKGKVAGFADHELLDLVGSMTGQTAFAVFSGPVVSELKPVWAKFLDKKADAGTLFEIARKDLHKPAGLTRRDALGVGVIAQSQTAAAAKRRPKPANPELLPVVFIHVPKTAGSTVHAALTRLLPPETAVVVNDRAGRQLVWNDRFRYVGGHVKFRRMQKMAPNARFITSMRDPVDRVVSNYRMAVRNEADVQSALIGERPEDRFSVYYQKFFKPHRDDLQCKYICGFPEWGRARDTIKRNFTLVWSIKKIDEAWNEVTALMGLGHHAMPPSKMVGDDSIAPFEITVFPHDRAFILERNQQDMQLWTWFNDECGGYWRAPR